MRRSRSYFRIMVGVILAVVVLSLLNKVNFSSTELTSLFNKDKN